MTWALYLMIGMSACGEAARLDQAPLSSWHERSRARVATYYHRALRVLDRLPKEGNCLISMGMSYAGACAVRGDTVGIRPEDTIVRGLTRFLVRARHYGQHVVDDPEVRELLEASMRPPVPA